MENLPEERTPAEAFGEYANLLWRWFWLLILLAFIFAGITYFVSNLATPIYESSTLVMMNPSSSYQFSPYEISVMAQQMGETYAKVMVTKPVLNSVAKQLNLPNFPQTAKVQVQTIQNTQLLLVKVQDIDPDRAALLANTLVNVFTVQTQVNQSSRYSDTEKSLQSQMEGIKQQIQDVTNSIASLNQKNQDINNQLTAIDAQIQLDTRLVVSADTLDADKSKRDQLQASYAQNQAQLGQLQTTQAQYEQSYNNLFQSLQNVKLSEAQNSSSFIPEDPAVSNKTPVRPKPLLYALLAAAVGFIIGAGIIILNDYLADTIRDPQQITKRWGIPVLGMIVNFKMDKNGAIITAQYPRSPVSEAFRSLRTNLQFASLETQLRTILVTSPSASEGKTTIAANLATVIAQSGRSVVVVDADLRRPSIHKIFQLFNRVGLTDQFINTGGLFDGALKSTSTSNLQVITSGLLPPNPSELLGSARMSEILHELSDRFDTVIIDTPPTLLVTDALVLGTRVDGVILVVKPSVTRWAALRQVIDQMHHNKAKLLGVVINNVKVNRSGYYYYRGYYQYNYGKGYHYYGEHETPDKVTQPTAVAIENNVFEPSKTNNLNKVDKYEPE